MKKTLIWRGKRWYSVFVRLLGRRFWSLCGLLMDGSMLLARSVILVDKQVIVRYIQVVPEVSSLPDMQGTFAGAPKLVKELRKQNWRRING